MDIAQLRAMLEQLAPLLANNMLSVRAASQEIEVMLSGSALAEHYQAVADAISLLKFQDALTALASFQDGLFSNPSI